MNEPVLSIKDVGKCLGNVAVLRGVSASLLPGTVTAFIGPNGAGKTTLFHTITGDLTSDTGVVKLRGHPITKMAPWRIARKGLGKMFQDVRVFENLTVIENMLLVLYDHLDRSAWASLSLTKAYIWWHSKPDLVKKAEACLEKAGVEPPYDRPAGLLSFGNKKLLALARLMAGRFDLLLLDEPTAGVSPVMISRITSMIEQLTSQGITVALIEHNFSFVADVAERTYLLREGRIHDFGPTAEVLGKEENREILIGL